MVERIDGQFGASASGGGTFEDAAASVKALSDAGGQAAQAVSDAQIGEMIVMTGVVAAIPMALDQISDLKEFLDEDEG